MEPTCSDTLILTTAEAHTIMYAVACNLRPLVRRRPGNDEERSKIRSGAVFVWEEGSGIERWTDRREWGDSRSREDFLFYTEGTKASQRAYTEPYLTGGSQWSSRPSQDPLIKQTYTATTHRPDGERKWHMIAYFTEGTKHRLRRVSDDPALRALDVPAGTFKQARLPKSRRLRGGSSHGPAPRPATDAHSSAMDVDGPAPAVAASRSSRQAYHHHHPPSRLSWGDDGSGGRSGSSSEDEAAPRHNASSPHTAYSLSATSPTASTGTSAAAARPRTYAAPAAPLHAQHWWAPARPDLPPLGFRGGPPPRRQPVDDAMLQRLHGSTVDVLMCAS